LLRIIRIDVHTGGFVVAVCMNLRSCFHIMQLVSKHQMKNSFLVFCQHLLVTCHADSFRYRHSTSPSRSSKVNSKKGNKKEINWNRKMLCWKTQCRRITNS